mgnify:CR=1 FL=1
MAAVLRAGPVRHHTLRGGVSEEDVAAFNDGHNRGDIDRVLGVVRALKAAVTEVWEVVRVLRVGWLSSAAAVAAAASAAARGAAAVAAGE